MGSKERVVEVKYKQHATLKQTVYLKNKGIEKCWVFETPDLTREYDYQVELTEILDELSIEGWELVCQQIKEEGYLLRTIDYLDDVVTYCDYDDED